MVRYLTGLNIKAMNRYLIPFVQLLTLVCCSDFGRAQSLPNVVMIISDDQAWTDYSFMDHKTIETPKLDALAKQSIVFRKGYVPTALCRPSLMTLVTGMYAHQHGVTGNDPSPKYAKRGSELDSLRRAKLISFIDKLPTLPKLLSKKGYVCHQSGKWWEGNFSRGGFTDGMTRGFPQKGGRHGDDGLQIGRQGLAPVTSFIDQAVDEEKPFFVWYAPLLPHTPHNPPDRLLKKYSAKVKSKTVAQYYAMCEWFDETCGQLLTHLDQAKVRDNTLVIYVCDNGWIQNPEKRGFALRSKQSPYEGGVRTPIMFRWPKKFMPADRSELCTSLDLVPTILSAAGITPTEKLPGLDLLKCLETGQKIEREAIFGESFAHDIADIEKPEASLLYRWCIEGRWKLILTYDGEANRHQAKHPRTDQRPQLFNLTDDPFETSNVAKDNEAVVERLAKKIKAWYPLHQRNTVETWSE